MRTPSEHRIELYEPSRHETLLFAAAASGVDISACIDGERYIGFGDTNHGFGPAAILDVTGTPAVVEPHVTWFPWVSTRQRVVHFKWFMRELAVSREILLTVEKSQIAFFEHFVKQGMLRKVGHLENLPVVEEIHMYQYKR